ncbi:hypothetical protein CONCODRAFT_20297 [Conidiobolus coronatus NRRL 28638]|uniref:G-protein coupled receptors family 1 profile domain-containing protein n=1 Tax=Conidiobolus coronatus (strain ATCC 28846 / CBS 209.66 / NRRL 28638) TaxID=796925 RepID=A0A137NU34_CONC2|nr:hypothetical protein CONCODRAFT_20297 [Conidiobolus coronatus NRRL 28638]|eukprot:KXN66315.1 hypothetical protein CONCODRAFT_20297 [Conidiobolus coronatus NRRL 28638]
MRRYPMYSESHQNIRMSDNDPDVIIGKILHPIGMVATGLVMLTLITLGAIDFKLINRLTIRLIASLAIADFAIHLSEILSLGTQDLIGTPYCARLSASRHFGRILYGFTNIAISFHLYRVIVKQKKSSWRYELAIWFGILFCTVALMLIFHFLGSYTGKLNKIECRPGSDDPTYFKLVEGLLGVFGLLTLVICVATYFISRRSFKNMITDYANLHIENVNEQDLFKSNRIKMAERSFLYPLATVITLPSPIALSVMDVIDYYPTAIYYLMVLTQGISGILTFIAFVLDPALWDSIKTAKEKVYNKFQERRSTALEHIGMRPRKDTNASNSTTNLNG